MSTPAGNIHHERKSIAAANGITFFWIPKICYQIRMKVSEDTQGRNQIDLHWKLVRSHNADITKDPESTDLGTDYASVSGNGEVVISDIRLLDNYLLLAQSSRANTTVEVTYITGY